MSRLIKIFSMTTVLVAALVVSVAGAVFADVDPIAIDMTVSPNVLNIESNSSYTHIHADVGYVVDAVATVVVNGEEIDSIFTFADDRGNLVVKFDIGQVKNIVIADDSDSADFVLTYTDGDDNYTGEDSAPVIRTPKNQ